MAAEADSSGNAQLVIAVFALLGVVITALGGVAVALINSRNKATADPPAATLPLETRAYERIAVVERRMDDNDDRDEVQDRRIDQIERVLDLDNPEWRHR